jgi:hypothetical protein
MQDKPVGLHMRMTMAKALRYKLNFKVKMINYFYNCQFIVIYNDTFIIRGLISAIFP